jgi:hypothetical protein
MGGRPDLRNAFCRLDLLTHLLANIPHFVSLLLYIPTIFSYRFYFYLSLWSERGTIALALSFIPLPDLCFASLIPTCLCLSPILPFNDIYANTSQMSILQYMDLIDSIVGFNPDLNNWVI